MPRKRSAPTVVRALEEARYGSQGLLNLRDSMPSEVEATTRAESWLRERQAHGITDVLIITGRGSGSPRGIAVIREGVRKRLHALRRKGVIDGFSENGPGSFSVTVAPLKRLFETSPRRSRPVPSGVSGSSGRKALRSAEAGDALIAGLDEEQARDLRKLAHLSLLSLGVTPDEPFLNSEMRRQFTLLATSLSEAEGKEQLLADAIRRALSEYEES